MRSANSSLARSVHSRIADELFVVSLDSSPDFVLAAYLIEQFC
jgi:hypothetical protein